MPGRPIEFGARIPHDVDMEFLTTLAAEKLLDPVLLVPALVVNVAFLSGSVAGAIDFFERILPQRTS